MNSADAAVAGAADHTEVGKALGTDYFLIRDELSEAEVELLERTRRFVDEEVLAVIGDYWSGPSFRGSSCDACASSGSSGTRPRATAVRP